MSESGKFGSSETINKEQLEKAGLIRNKDSKVKLIMGKDNSVKLKFKVAVDSYSKNAKAFGV